MHVRGQIREAVRALLITIPELSDRVFFDSDEIPEGSEMPCALVSLGNESIEHETLGGSTGATLKRETELTVDILNRAARDALLVAEGVCASVESVIANSSSLLALLRSWFPQEITISRDAEGSQAAVQLSIQYVVTYSTNERDATVAIP